MPWRPSRRCATCSSRSVRILTRDGLQDTPARVARAYAEMFRGLHQTADEVLTTTFDLGHDEMVLVKDIELYSTCEHHLVPFHGVAHIGYIPNESGRITGLSKLARLVDVFAKRPAGPGAADDAGRRLAGAHPRATWRDRRHGGRAPVHVDARRAQARGQDRHECRAWQPSRSGHARGGHVPDPGSMIRRPRGLPPTLASLDRTVVMGVLNVTPDSFSDGGEFLDAQRAVDHGRHLHAAGADIVDVGGESTRPGAQRVPLEEELRRVLPVIEGLTAAGVPVSIDTMRAECARAAVAGGRLRRQRRQRWPGRRGHVLRCRRARRSLHRDALARPQRPHERAGAVRRRRARRHARAARPSRCRDRGRRRSGRHRRRPGTGLRQGRRPQLADPAAS